MVAGLGVFRSRHLAAVLLCFSSMHVMHRQYYAHSSVGVHSVLLHIVSSPAGYCIACLDRLTVCTITLSTRRCLACMVAICCDTAASSMG
jgi:hypothetical protein